MALLVPDSGESYLLQALVGKLTATAPILRLYKTNITPAETDTLATYSSNYPTFTGYAAITLTSASWTVSGTAPTQIAYAQQTFTCTANQSTEQVYGYIVTDTTPGTTLLWAEKFTDGPYPITNNGDAIKITPQITAD